MKNLFKNLKNTVVAATKSVATSVVKVVKATCALIGNAVATVSFSGTSFLIETFGAGGAHFISFVMVWVGIYLTASVFPVFGLLLAFGYVVFQLCYSHAVYDGFLKMAQYYDPNSAEWKLRYALRN